ncbi:MAG: hypothetical protein OCD02_11420 [Spirochaetaceae bacterium]
MDNLTTDDGLTNNQINNITGSGNYIFIGTLQGLSIYNISTNSFETAQLGTNDVDCLFVSDTKVYAGTYTNGLFISDIMIYISMK